MRIVLYCNKCGYPLDKIYKRKSLSINEGYFYCNECKTKSVRFKECVNRD